MKILPVSFVNFKSKQNNSTNNYDLAYLYTMPETKKKDFLLQFKFLTALAAITAVAATLFNISGKKKFPYSVANISDVNKGLNKIKNNDKLIESLKTDFVYPIKAAILGDKKIQRTKEFKSALILTGKNNETLDNISNALCEHFNELNINTIEIPHKSTKFKDGEIISSDLKRNEINKRVIKEIKNSQNAYKKDGTYTIMNLGNLDDLTDLKIVKSQKSKFEKLITNLSQNTENSGIIWIGWTDKQKDIPLFLSYLPILIKKVQ